MGKTPSTVDSIRASTVNHGWRSTMGNHALTNASLNEQARSMGSHSIILAETSPGVVTIYILYIASLVHWRLYCIKKRTCNSSWFHSSFYQWNIFCDSHGLIYCFFRANICHTSETHDLAFSLWIRFVFFRFCFLSIDFEFSLTFLLCTFRALKLVLFYIHVTYYYWIDSAADVVVLLEDILHPKSLLHTLN